MLSLLPIADEDPASEPTPAPRPAPRVVTGWCLGLAPGRVAPAPSPRRYEDPKAREESRRRAAARRAAREAEAAAARALYQPPIPWPIPLAPIALAAVLVDDGVRLSWAAAGGAEAYIVRRASTPGGPYEVIAAGARLTRGTNQTVTPGETYYYTVSARNAAGESSPSLEVAVRIPTPAELVEELSLAPARESHQARARRLARLELARLELARPRGGVPAKAISMFAKKKLSLTEIETGKALCDEEIPARSYPECIEDTAPCYFARCRHHLMTDVNRFGSLKIPFPGWDVDEVPETCSVRVARRGKQTVDTVASLFNLTPEAVRMIERDAWRKMERLIDPEKLWRRERSS